MNTTIKPAGLAAAQGLDRRGITDVAARAAGGTIHPDTAYAAKAASSARRKLSEPLHATANLDSTVAGEQDAFASTPPRPVEFN